MSLKDRLLAGLTSIYDKTQDSNIGRLITIVTDQIEEIYLTGDNIKKSRDVDQAFGETLDKIGENVQQQRGELQDPTYRLLIKSKVARNRSTGDINSILSVMSTMLDIDIKEVTLEENPGGEPASIYFEMPLSAIGKYELAREHFVIIINRITSAGVRAYTMLNGTFKLGDATNITYNNDTGLGDVNDDTVGGELGSWHEPINTVELPDW